MNEEEFNGLCDFRHRPNCAVLLLIYSRRSPCLSAIITILLLLGCLSLFSKAARSMTAWMQLRNWCQFSMWTCHSTVQ